MDRQTLENKLLDLFDGLIDSGGNEGYFRYLFFDLELAGRETMNIHAEQPGAVGALALRRVTISRFDELRTALINALDKVSHLRSNFEKVTDIELSYLQLIVRLIGPLRVKNA